MYDPQNNPERLKNGQYPPEVLKRPETIAAAVLRLSRDPDIQNQEQLRQIAAARQQAEAERLNTLANPETVNEPSKLTAPAPLDIDAIRGSVETASDETMPIYIEDTYDQEAA